MNATSLDVTLRSEIGMFYAVQSSHDLPTIWAVCCDERLGGEPVKEHPPPSVLYSVWAPLSPAAVLTGV